MADCRCRYGGSPAHAGIDPRRPPNPPRPPRLPRACGDRPQSRSRRRGERAAPPRMRGSTRARREMLLELRGSPAHAGIDPVSDSGLRFVYRLPRACGDRPQRRTVGRRARAAPPRMRGSTLSRHSQHGGDLGSPAHAGIDPIRSGDCGGTRWLPRACGDRPEAEAMRHAGRTAPPRMRGSTRPRSSPRHPRSGSPAHAGIDLRDRNGARPAPRLPRACGDRPHSTSRHACDAEAPPRMRGSTLLYLVVVAVAGGSPAHAGIDPEERLLPAGVSRLPRACGDRPQSPRPTR